MAPGVKCALALVIAAPWFGVPASATDLLEAYKAARANDPFLRAQHEDLEVAQAGVEIAASALRPLFGANGQLSRTGGPETYTGLPAVQRTFNIEAWTLQLSQPLLHAGTILAYREARQQRSTEERRYAAAEQDLILRTVKSYLDVLAATETLAAANAQLAAASEQQSLTNEKFKQRVISIIDYNETTTYLERARAQQVQADTDLQIRIATLEQITGPLILPLAALREGITPPSPVPPDLTMWTEAARDNNLTALADEEASVSARTEVDRMRAQRLPTVDAVASYGRQFSSGNGNQILDYGVNSYPWEVGVQFSWAIFDGGTIHAQVNQAEARWRKAQALLDASRRQAIVDAQTAYQAVVSGLAKIRSMRAAVEAAGQAVDGNTQGYRLGIRINRDVLEAQEQKFSAQRDLARAKYETIFQGLKLKAAAGALEEEDVRAVNRALDTRGSK